MRQIENLLGQLDPGEYAPRILTLSPEPDNSMWEEMRARGVTVGSLNLSRLQAVVTRNWREIIESAVGGPPAEDVIYHTHGIRADIIASRSLPVSRTVATLHNYPPEGYVAQFGKLRGTLMAVAHIRALRRLPRLVACSAFVAARLARHAVRSEVIRNGVDVDRYRPATAEEKAALRRSLGLDRWKRVVISVGSLNRLKNPQTIVRAFRLLADERSCLLVIGGGECEQACRRIAAGDPRIVIVGRQDDVVGYLKAGDVFVSASRSEGLPTAVLEALACGLFVILSDIEPHREVLEVVPDAGVLFPLNDARALASALAATPQANPQAVDSVRRHFSAAAMAGRYRSVYESLWNRHAHRGISPAAHN